MAGGRIQLVQQIAARRETIWRACGSAEGLARWQADRVEGEIAPGRVLRLSWPALGRAIELVVEEVRAGERLVTRSGGSTVELHVEDGAVRLVQSGFEPDDDVEGFASSWRVTLALLAHSVEDHPERDRRVRWFVRHARATPQAAYLMLTEAAGLRAWLGHGGDIGPIGSHYSISVHRGPRVSGRVLANVHGRDVALSWDEDASALVLRTFPSSRSGERIITLLWSRWGPEPPGDALVQALEASMDRFGAVLGRTGTS